MAARIAWISIAPVKKLALQQLREVRLERDGVRENRRFFLVHADGGLVRNVNHGGLVPVQSAWDEDAGRLELRFPDGRVVTGQVTLGEPVQTDFYGRPVAGHVVVGPWAEALSAWVGDDLRLVQADEVGGAVDRPNGLVTLVSTASVEAFAAAAGTPVDERRFRMLFGVEGLDAYEEDGWIGRAVHLGDAVVVPRGHVGRCYAITRNPETGDSDFDALKLMARHRRGVDATEPIPFGISAEVVQPGTVRLGDEVAVGDLLDAATPALTESAT